ncbi:MAG: cytochrome c family protein [Brevundimonas sp.]|uniref:c-type cytochrome n=1 Tax=Brevundimonas sp. TaxID=1871086 RepID=UPI00271E17B3|nr:cytochrome c family protein [Brevundimonas sp.]MDO9077389.1 cytochrome c family protein [Brevundimonas sp.]MDP3080147.1 cytochrome c family protein [Brevundimonas sp.]MDZ4061734.1 cytochrome c family protein [Brevundimonas sp.]
MSGDLKWNKIMGAGLATVLVILMVKEGTAFIYHNEAPEKMGYFVNAPEESAGGAAEEAVLPPDWGTLLPTADLASGEAAFARCKSCHTVNAGGANGIGPNLFGVIGGPVTHSAGFAYSDALIAHKGTNPTWTLDEMDLFLTAPGRHVPGTKMSFAGIRDTATRVNLIAWLRSQGSGGMAIPAPDPARQPGAAPAAPVEGAAPVAGAETAAADAGGPTGGAPVAGPAGVAATQATPAAPPAATSAPR